MSEKLLTKEQKEKLKSIGNLGFSLKNEWPYVPKAYREKDKNDNFIIDKELWPIFILKGLDGVESSLMGDKLHSGIKLTPNGTTMELNRGNVTVETCKLGIVTWKNFRNDKFETIPPPEKDEALGGISKESVRVLPPGLMVELTNAITEHDRLSDEELLGLEL